MVMPAVGTIVQHSKFGAGKVTAVHGSGDGCKLTIHFEDGASRQLLARFVTWTSVPPPAPAGPTVLQRLLADVLQNPDHDDPRLVYADKLSEAGDPRGEFIVVQCRLASGNLAIAERAALEARERDLLDRGRERWLRPFGGVSGIRFVRGFLHTVRISEIDFAKYGAALLAAEPIECLEMHFRDGFKVPRFAKTAGLARLRELRLIGGLPYGNLSSNVFAGIAGSPHLVGLSTLVIGCSYSARWSTTVIDLDGARALAEWRHEHLLHLALEHCKLDVACATILGASPYLARLELVAVNTFDWADGADWLEALLRPLTAVRQVVMMHDEPSVTPVMERVGFHVAPVEHAMPEARELIGIHKVWER